MEQTLTNPPLFQKLAGSKTILLSGAGGGFDIYSGIPLLFALRSLGKEVILGNLSFTFLRQTTARIVHPHCYEVTAQDHETGFSQYFPERILQQFLNEIGVSVPLYAFEKVGAKPLRKAYDFLIDKHDVDTVILVDGGTDSLMFGDEAGLGTPHEDICSIAAVRYSKAPKRLVSCLGFGVDHYHGVSHFRFLENVASLQKAGGYFGTIQLLPEMEEAKRFLQAVDFSNQQMRGMESIVSNSIYSALKGDYGNVHRTKRTASSKLWINPLMTMYWSFDLDIVADHIAYLDAIKEVVTMAEFEAKLAEYRSHLADFRRHQDMKA